MMRKLKGILCLWLVLGQAHYLWAFSMLGTNDTWQVSQLSYLVTDALVNVPSLVDSPLGGPMNLGEEYRWNIRHLNYAFDANYLDYFGSNGVQAVEQAMAILNSVTNASAYSDDLSEVPLEATRINFRAGALGLLDLKSTALHLLVEQLGLANPVRYSWTLRARAQPPGAACPVYVYLVIKRNFDPVTYEPSSYVNGSLYSYRIQEYCPVVDRAEAIEFLVDPFSRYYTSVASPGIFDGSFFTGLTRDDVGGLRYLLRTNNVNFENGPQGTTLISGGITNPAARQLLFSSNLATFTAQALTNGPAVLQALYPNLLITGTENIFTNVVTTNVVAFFTNFPWSPSTSPASLVISNILQTNVVIWFQHRFANVVTNTYYTNRRVTVLETNIGACGPPAPSGTVCTNISTRNVTDATVSGDFYIVPPGLCAYSIVATQLVRVLPITNLVLVATNATANTNIAGQEFSRSLVTYFTNYIFVADPVDCATNGPTLRQGIEKVNFHRRSFDSLLGRFYEPATNRFQITMVTNNMAIAQTFERVSVQPDFLFTADDVATDPTTFPILPLGYAVRSIQFDNSNAGTGLPGPGLILPGTVFVFNKVGPSFYNPGPPFLTESESLPLFVWGSFDGSTNPPTVYPRSLSIVALENQVLMHVVTSSLPNGRRGVAYSAQLQGERGEPPYSWRLAPRSTPLPPGLDLLPDGSILGVPGAAGDYPFTVRMIDSGARASDRPLSIRIDP